ncbi:MAG: aldehyde dehydrogenase family protein, partial [Acidimicrobiales bacterium]
MRTSMDENPKMTGPQPLGPRVTRERLGQLAARVVTTEPRDPLPIEMPATGDVLGHVPHCAASDVTAAAERARGLQAAWDEVPVAGRARVLTRFADLVLDRQDEVLDLIQLENGKARRHAFEEIIDVAQVSRYYARTAQGYLRRHRRVGAFPFLTRTWEERHAKGLVGVISPWNYPLTLGITDALPALVAGN